MIAPLRLQVMVTIVEVLPLVSPANVRLTIREVLG